MSVTGPVKPSARSVSAALRPASEAPTITMRPLSLKAALAPLLLMRFPCVLQCSRCDSPVFSSVLAARCPWPLDLDRLHRTRCGSAQHMLTLRFVRGWIVPERLLAMQLEDVGGHETALGIGLAPIEIHDDTDRDMSCRCSRTFRHKWVLSCHLRFLTSASGASGGVATSCSRASRVRPKGATVHVLARHWRPTYGHDDSVTRGGSTSATRRKTLLTASARLA